MARKMPAVALRRKAAVFVEPVLTAEVEYPPPGRLRKALGTGRLREYENSALQKRGSIHPQHSHATLRRVRGGRRIDHHVLAFLEPAHDFGADPIAEA